MSILLAVPIAVVYPAIINKLADIITKDNVKDSKKQQILMVEIIGGISGLFAAYFLQTSSYKNTVVTSGIVLGSLFLIFNSVIFNWSTISDTTKLLCLIVVIVVAILFAYLLTRS